MLYSFFKNAAQFVANNSWLGWVWSFFILAACTWPGKDIPSAPIVGFDKIVHAGLFTIWSLLWLLALPRKAQSIIIIGMAYGLGLEFYQQLLPFDRTFDWWDAMADAVGVLLGYAFKSFIVDRYLHRLY